VRVPSRSLALVVLLAIAAPAAAADYPARPIRAIASQGPGGLSDIWMRALAEELGPLLGQSVVLGERMGAAGELGGRR
jgi:tripartite-type tricarboxylate transporter receptor subunit TctC